MNCPTEWVDWPHTKPLYTEEGLVFCQAFPSLRQPHVHTLMSSIYPGLGTESFPSRLVAKFAIFNP